MENLFSVSTLLTSEGFSLNTDILDTNLINILILVVVLVQFIGSSLKTALNERKEEIIDTVSDAEKRLIDAQDRLVEANNQLAQTKISIDKIVQELQSTKINIIKTGTVRLRNEMLSQMKASELTIALQEQKLLTEIKKQILTLAIKRVNIKFKNDLTVLQHIKIIDKSIDRIGGIN